MEPRGPGLPFGIDLPTLLTPLGAAIGVWVAAASQRVLTGMLPGALAAALVVCDLALWRARGKRWHDAPTILLLLPAIACALWIGVGGTVLHVHRSEAGRLLLEIGPGLALTGTVVAVVSYHGRHRPQGP